MKICPTCQQQYPNGFQYCPNDTDVLVTAEEYLRRTKPIAQTPPPSESPTIPIVRQPRADAPSTQATQQAPAQANAVVPPPTVRLPEAAPSRPVAPTAPVNTPRNASTGAPQRNANQAAANGAKANHSSAPQALVPATGSAFGGGGGLSFSMPEQGSLIQRLSTALQNISDSFSGKGGGKAGDTGDFKFLLKEESLVARVGRELSTASADFKRDPKSFIIATIKGEGSSKQRQRWILNGMASAVIVYSLLFFVVPAIILLIWGKQVVAVEEKKEESLQVLAELTQAIPDKSKPKSADKALGSKPIPKKSSGGGGGGREQPTPPSKGRPPQMALTPQIILPNPEPPKIKNPTLVVASTIYGDPKNMPPMKGPIGDPLGVPAPPSSGPGKGGGIGNSEGTGVGRGQGGGAGAGRGGNSGGGDMDIGGGRGIEEMGKNGVGKPTILYKEKAKYTEEARQNKVQGTVVLNVIFTADGRITNIRTVRGLPDGLTEKAIEAAQRIRFQPATKNGQAVSVRGNLEFTFNLY